MITALSPSRYGALFAPDGHAASRPAAGRRASRPLFGHDLIPTPPERVGLPERLKKGGLRLIHALDKLTDGALSFHWWKSHQTGEFSGEIRRKLSDIGLSNKNHSAVHELGHLLLAYFLPGLWSPEGIFICPPIGGKIQVLCILDSKKYQKNIDSVFGGASLNRARHYYESITEMGGVAASRILFPGLAAGLPLHVVTKPDYLLTSGIDLMDTIVSARKLLKANPTLNCSTAKLQATALEAAEEILRLVPDAAWRGMITELKRRKNIQGAPAIREFIERHLPQFSADAAASIARRHLERLMVETASRPA